MSSQVNEIHKALYGNGQAGIENRLTRAEEKILYIYRRKSKKQTRSLKNSKSVSCLKGQKLIRKSCWKCQICIQLKDSFSERKYSLRLLFVVAIHSLLPEGLNLWELIKKYFLDFNGGILCKGCRDCVKKISGVNKRTGKP